MPGRGDQQKPKIEIFDTREIESNTNHFLVRSNNNKQQHHTVAWYQSSSSITMRVLYEEGFYSLPAFWYGFYHVRITDEELNFGFTFSCTQKRVALSEIRKVTHLDWQDPLCNWGGWGIRWMM